MRLTYSKVHRLSQLHEELLAAIPALQPVGDGMERRAVMRVEGSGDDIILTVPDAVDEQDVAAVIDAHVPVEPPTPPDFTTLGANDIPAVKTAIEGLRDYMALSSPTGAQSTAALKALIRVVRHLAR